MLHIADLHWELGQGQVAVGFWVPSLLILLEAESFKAWPNADRRRLNSALGISSTGPMGLGSRRQLVPADLQPLRQRLLSVPGIILAASLPFYPQMFVARVLPSIAAVSQEP